MTDHQDQTQDKFGRGTEILQLGFNQNNLTNVYIFSILLVQGN